MPRSGGVRASSHLPERREPEAPYRALSQISAQDSGRQLQHTEEATPHQDGVTAAKASGVFDAVRQQFNNGDSSHYMDENGNLRPRDEARQQDSPARHDPRSPQFGAGAPSHSPGISSSASDDTSPWYMPPITPEDLNSLHHDDDEATDSSSVLNGRPQVHDLVHRTPGASTPKVGLQDLVYRFKGSPEQAKNHSQPVTATRKGAAPSPYVSRPDTSVQYANQKQGQSPPLPPSHDDSQQPATPQKATTSASKQEAESAKKAIPTTTVRIGDHPSFENINAPQKEIDEWNKAFRDTYGQLAADAAKKNGVPARLLAALSANEMAAPNWDALHAFADRNTFTTKSAGPLQIAYQTALRYKLIPIDNEFYGATQADRWTALHDPDTRYGQSEPSTGLTPDQRLNYYQDNPYPNRHGSQIMHSYLDNPATSFDAGAKLLKIYLQRLVDDYKSGAYLNYSQDFRAVSGLSSPIDPIHKDLNILASGDKEAIFNLRISENLARALAMMWNNGEDIVNVRNISELSPRAYAHGDNIRFQQENQDDLIPRH